MGFLSSIVGGLATAAFGPVGGAIAGAVVGAGEQRYAEKKQNEAIDRANDLAIERESTQFVRMRDAAQRAGFNPLTVLRSGMFQQAGLLSRQAETWKGSLFGGVANAVINAPELRLDREMRELERQERMANVEYTGNLSRSVLNSLNSNSNTGFNPRQEPIITTTAIYYDPITGVEYRGPNPEAMEIGVGEVVAGGIMHPVLAIPQISDFWERGRGMGASDPVYTLPQLTFDQMGGP